MVKHTLRERAAIYFGSNNTKNRRWVPLGRDSGAFIGPRTLWIYSDFPRGGVVVNLSDKMRADLVDALSASQSTEGEGC